MANSLLEPESIAPVAASAAGAVSGALANRSTDGTGRRVMDAIAGTLSASYLGPLTAMVIIWKLGIEGPLQHTLIGGVCYVAGIVGSTVTNAIFDKVKNGGILDWLRSLLDRARPGLLLLLALIHLGLSGSFNRARAQSLIPQPMPAPPAMQAASDRPAGFLARQFHYLSRFWEVLRGK